MARTSKTALPVSEELMELWREFKATASASARERLILHYAPLVKYVAGRVATGLPATVEQADLVSYGMFGLIDALDKFDLDRAIKFETYAIPRIKGAIIDELRAMDWVPRSVRFKAREVEKAYAALESRLHRTPEELVQWLFRAQDFPVGVVLMTGTSIIPEAEFTLRAMDEVRIAITGLGELVNTVEEVGS